MKLQFDVLIEFWGFANGAMHTPMPQSPEKQIVLVLVKLYYFQHDVGNTIVQWGIRDDR